ncbi:MAG: hypothetical protein ACYDD6_01765, partial [Acidimicrobiales bacterium]
MGEVRLQTVSAAILATYAVIGVLLLYALIPGRSVTLRWPYFGILGVAALGTLGISLLPWRAFVEQGLVLPALYIWSVLDAGLVATGIAFSGGSRSDVYLVYLVLCVFQAGVAYPRRGRTALVLTLIGSYLLTLAGTGWGIGT